MWPLADGWRWRHDTFSPAGGWDPWGHAWKVFLYATERGLGMGLRFDDDRATRACCLRPVRSGMRPMAYIEIAPGRGVILVHMSPYIELLRYECDRCEHVRVTIQRIVAGRAMGVPQIAVVFVSAGKGGANDGVLSASDGSRHWTGLPPSCSTARCPTGLAWGSLEPGTETVFDP